MDDDEYIFEMFLVMMEILSDNPKGRMRVLSMNPRYVEDETKEKTKRHKR